MFSLWGTSFHKQRCSHALATFYSHTVTDITIVYVYLDHKKPLFLKLSRAYSAGESASECTQVDVVSKLLEPQSIASACPRTT